MKKYQFLYSATLNAAWKIRPMLLLILQPKNYLYFILVLCPFVTICTYCIAYCYCIVYTCLCKYLIGLIWYLMPLSTIFQLYCGGKLKAIKKFKEIIVILKGHYLPKS